MVEDNPFSERREDPSKVSLGGQIERAVQKQIPWVDGQRGIHPQDEVTGVRYGKLGEPILIEVRGFQVALGRGIAARILVEQME